MNLRTFSQSLAVGLPIIYSIHHVLDNHRLVDEDRAVILSEALFSGVEGSAFVLRPLRLKPATEAT
jgi:hypothetical protein